MIRSALLVVNPSSRLGKRHYPRALEAFREASVTVDAVLTERAGHAALIAEELAPFYEAVFTLGGDGTAMEVLAVATAAGRSVGVLPGGTGNLIARALGTPMDVKRAVRALLAGREDRIDLGALADGRTFAFAAGIGIDVSMLERTSTAAKRRFGVFAYMMAAARVAIRPKPFMLTANVDGNVRSFVASAALVANFGDLLGGLIQLGPRISPSDGELDLCVFTPQGLGQALVIGWRAVRRRFADCPTMHFIKGRVIRLETAPLRMAQADGEFIGTTPLTCTVLPLAARVLVPGARNGSLT